MILHLHAELDLAPQHGLGLDKYEAHEEGEERAGHHQGGAQVQAAMFHVRDDLLQLPDPDTLGQGLDI